jgi:hypothetical protein
MATSLLPPDNTTQVFDQFYNININVASDEYEIVLSWFRSICSTEQIAQNFTAFVFIIASNTKISPLDLLAQMQGRTGIEIDALLAYYLNSSKTKSALYGVANPITPNFYVQRNIIQ